MEGTDTYKELIVIRARDFSVSQAMRFALQGFGCYFRTSVGPGHPYNKMCKYTRHQTIEPGAAASRVPYILLCSVW